MKILKAYGGGFVALSVGLFITQKVVFWLSQAWEESLSLTTSIQRFTVSLYGLWLIGSALPFLLAGFVLGFLISGKVFYHGLCFGLIMATIASFLMATVLWPEQTFISPLYIITLFFLVETFSCGLGALMGQRLKQKK